MAELMGTYEQKRLIPRAIEIDWWSKDGVTGSAGAGGFLVNEPRDQRRVML